MKFAHVTTNPELLRLLAATRNHVMTPDEIREQRISFVYGQMMDCAPNLTKDDVRRISDEMHGLK